MPNPLYSGCLVYDSLNFTITRYDYSC